MKITGTITLDDGTATDFILERGTNPNPVCAYQNNPYNGYCWTRPGYPAPDWSVLDEGDSRLDNILSTLVTGMTTFAGIEQP